MLSYHKRNAQTTIWKSKDRIAKKSIVLRVMLRQVLGFFTALDDVLPEPADWVCAEPSAAQSTTPATSALWSNGRIWTSEEYLTAQVRTCIFLKDFKLSTTNTTNYPTVWHHLYISNTRHSAINRSTTSVSAVCNATINANILLNQPVFGFCGTCPMGTCMNPLGFIVGFRNSFCSDSYAAFRVSYSTCLVLRTDSYSSRSVMLSSACFVALSSRNEWMLFAHKQGCISCSQKDNATPTYLVQCSVFPEGRTHELATYSEGQERLHLKPPTILHHNRIEKPTSRPLVSPAWSNALQVSNKHQTLQRLIDACSWVHKKQNHNEKSIKLPLTRKKKQNATCEKRPYPARPDSNSPRHAIQNDTVCMIPRETSIDISKILKLMWVNIAIRMLRRKRHNELHRFF